MALLKRFKRFKKQKLAPERKPDHNPDPTTKLTPDIIRPLNFLMQKLAPLWPSLQLPVISGASSLEKEPPMNPWLSWQSLGSQSPRSGPRWRASARNFLAPSESPIETRIGVRRNRKRRTGLVGLWAAQPWTRGLKKLDQTRQAAGGGCAILPMNGVQDAHSSDWRSGGKTKALAGVDKPFIPIVQMPARGFPSCHAWRIGARPPPKKGGGGAANAGLMAAGILAVNDPESGVKLDIGGGISAPPSPRCTQDEIECKR